VFASKMELNAKFHIMEIWIQGLFKDFQVLSSILSVFKHFQGPQIYFSETETFSRIS